MTTICSGTGKHATRSVDGIWMTCPVCGMYTVPYPNGTVRRHGPFQTRRIDAEHKVARLTLEEARLTADLQTVKAERDAMQRRAEAAERDWQYAEAEVLGLTARIDVSAVEIVRLTAALQQAQTWRTMDSAPKDGTEILVSYDDDECVQVVTWDATCEGWLICENIYLTPTYWMPIPALPPPPAGDAHPSTQEEE